MPRDDGVLPSHVVEAGADDILAHPQGSLATTAHPTNKPAGAPQDPMTRGKVTTVADGLRRYYDQQTAVVEKNLLAVQKKMDPDGIHDLRVGIKRLRAFFLLMNGLDPAFKPNKHYRKALRLLFKIAGPLRDAHIMLASTRSLEREYGLHIPQQQKELKRAEARARRKFLQFAGGYDSKVLKKKRRHVDKSLNCVSPKDMPVRVTRFFIKLLKSLVDVGNESRLNDVALHQVRILSKQTRYTGEMLQGALRDGAPPERLQAALRNVDRCLGDWHDHVVNLQFLDSLRKQYTDRRRKDAKRFEEVVAQTRKNKSRLRKQFRKAWRAFTAMAPAQ